MELLMDKEFFIMKMEIKNMKDVLNLIIVKEREYHIMKMEINNMKVNG